MAIRSNVDRLKSLIPVSENSTATPKNNSGGLFRLQAVLNNRVYKQRNNNPPQVQESTTEINQDSANPQNNSVSSDYQDDSGFKVGAELDNRDNVYIAQDALGYNTPMSAEDQLKLVSEYENKKMERDAAMAGVASLQNAFGKTGGFSTVFGSYTPR